MSKNKVNEDLIDKLVELNELEITKARVSAVLFKKTIDGIMENKIKTMESSFEEQARYYGQSLENYENIYNEIITKYREQLEQIFDKYTTLYINMYMELQEAECNQKIAIANIKSSYDIIKNKEKSKKENIEEYEKKINACLEKKKNYDIIINKCEEELNECFNKIENQIDEIFSDKANLLYINDENFFGKMINKVKNLFVGKSRFNLYVIESLNIELDTIDGKLIRATNSIQRDTIDFVAKVKQAKEEINLIFENMI